MMVFFIIHENHAGLPNLEMKDHLLPLSLFPNTFDGAAASSVFAEDYDEAEDALGLLLEFSLVRHVICVPPPLT